MKKHTILLILFILVVALTLGACSTSPPENDDTTPPESDNPPSQPENPVPPTPPKPKTAKEAIELFLSTIENNFSASGEIISNLGDLFTGGQKYSILVDGNKIFTDNKGEIYYVEKALDGNEYVYLQQDDAWVKKLITEEDNYPSNMSIVTDLLEEVTWESYDATTHFAEGQFKFEDKDMWIECEMRSDAATVTIYQIKHSWFFDDTLVPIGNIEIYDVGSTTVELPTNLIEQTETILYQSVSLKKRDALFFKSSNIYVYRRLCIR